MVGKKSGTDKSGTKNYAKYESYALAFRLIDESVRHNFPLQAIAIEESVIADRLWSTLNIGKPPTRSKNKTLGDALREWKPKDSVKESKRNPNRLLFDEEMECLCPDLGKWWKKRNVVLHGIVKSAHGESPNISADEFEDKALVVARKGLELAREVDKWTKKRIHRAKSQSKVS